MKHETYTTREWSDDNPVSRGVYNVIVGVAKVRELIALWSARSRTRRQIADLDARQLKDIGLTELDARVEYGKPFWKA